MPDELLDEILANNERFLQTTRLPLISHAPRKHLAVVTCMDCRLLEMFEPALGLKRGDAVELRTAGATISQPERERAANDLIRSLAGGLGGVNGLVNWVGAFSDVHLNVQEIVQVIRNSPYLPKLPVHGLVIDIESGKLEPVRHLS